MYSFVLQYIWISSLLAVQMGTIIERNENLLISVTLFSVYLQCTSILVHSVISTCSYSHGPFLGGLLRWISSAWKLRLDLWNLWNSIHRFLYWFLITFTYCNLIYMSCTNVVLWHRSVSVVNYSILIKKALQPELNLT